MDSGHELMAREMGLKVDPKSSPSSWVGVTQSGLWALGRAGSVAGPLALGLLAPVPVSWWFGPQAMMPKTQSSSVTCLSHITVS